MKIKRWLYFIFVLIPILVISCAGTQGNGETTSNPADEAFVKLSQKAGEYEGLEVGYTEEGYPYMGSLDAPIILEEYSDFLCPYCARHFSETLPALKEQYIKTGQVLYVFHDLPLASLHPTASLGHTAARCVAEQDPAFFWSMHDRLFTQQSVWNQLQNPASYLAGMADALEVNKRAYEKCIEEGVQASAVQASVTEGNALGFNATPSFRFVVRDTGEAHTLAGAYPLAEFARRLDALIAGEPMPQVEEEEETQDPGQLPFWVSAKGLAPDPDRPGFNMAGDPYKGNLESSLVVIEFSDFDCEVCQRHALDVQPVLQSEFIEPGKILWVFKNFPMREHPNATVASAAAECAGDQGKFWEMYTMLYERRNAWNTEEADAVILSWSEEMSLDAETFSTCINSRQVVERILPDLFDAQGIINATPTFVLVAEGRGSLLPGSISVEQFVAAIQEELDASNNE